MEPLIIKETIATPKVIFDIQNNDFELKGCSRPEDVRDFYVPIIEWLQELKATASDELKSKFTKEQPIVFKFIFDYFNSSSAKFILDILVLINEIHESGLSLRIDWFHDENDEDMKEVGEELSEVVDLPFEYVIIEKGSSFN